MPASELYRKLWQDIQKHDGKLDKGARELVKRLLDALHQSSAGRFTPAVTVSAAVKVALNEGDLTLEPALEDELTAYFNAIENDLKAAISTAIETMAGGYAVLGSRDVKRMAVQAFTERWPDGLRLSDRVWRYQEETRQGLFDVLQTGVKQQAASSRLIYDMQRSIERGTAAQRFEIVSNNQVKWVDRLKEVAKGAIHNPESKNLWNKTVEETEAYISQLAKTGTRSASEQLLKKIREAVAKGNVGLLDESVKWWVYDKQLYNLKRIARTEMATAGHRAVIASTKDDEDIIGYQWRLSASHPVTDICDYYADIDMGLGKGVWTKETVPGHKAHPHCMCLLIPRTTPIRQKGAGNYGAFLNRLPEDKRNELLPDWLRNLNQLGLPLDKLVRPDGLGPLTRAMMKERLGERYPVADTISRALAEPEWGSINPKTHKSKLRKTMEALSHYREHAEVGRLLSVLEKNELAPSLDYHYLYRRFIDGNHFRSKADYQAFCSGILKTADSRVYKQVSNQHARYAIYRPSDRWLTIIDGQTHRYISAFRLDDAANPEDLGEFVCLQQQLTR